MKTSSFKAAGGLAAVVGVAALLASPMVQALPPLVKRAQTGANGMGIPMLIISIIEFLQDKNAYDADVKDKCVIRLTTSAGAYCTATVACGDLAAPDQMSVAYGGHEYGDWNVCYLNGRQFFTDPDLGDFSVTFTAAGGVDGNTEDGLHHPVIQLAGYNDWEPFVVQDILNKQGDADSGLVCKHEQTAGTQLKQWWCGLPKKGADAAFGMSLMDGDSDIPGYTPGWCTAHIAQYQRNEFGTGANFEFDVTLHDADGKQIGHVQRAPVDDDGWLSVASRLPATLNIHAGSGDDDFVTFAYQGQSWSCDDDEGGAHDCTLGDGKDWGYENGDREGDLGSSC